MIQIEGCSSYWANGYVVGKENAFPMGKTEVEEENAGVVKFYECVPGVRQSSSFACQACP
jgi:hypothetical protein